MNSRLIDHIDLLVPNLPPMLQGCKIAHITDLHASKPRNRFQHLASQLSLMQLDLVFFTGDYISGPGDEPAGLQVMEQLCAKLNPRMGSFGVYGNHDTHELRTQLADLPVSWLNNAAKPIPDLPLEILGFDMDELSQPDTVLTIESLADSQLDHISVTPNPISNNNLRILLSHSHQYLPTAADLGMHLMFSGHTHGGQCRLPGLRPLYNSTDLPLRLTSGILRHRDTLCVVSRGLGENGLPFRMFCPPHLPVYTLRRGPLPGKPTDHVINVVPW